MQFRLYNIGKTDSGYISEGIRDFSTRINHFYRFEMIDLPAVKNAASMPVHILTGKEGELLTKALESETTVVLLDEAGKQMTSRQFANWIGQAMVHGTNSMAFVTGGAYGFPDGLKARSSHKISLSRMTFTHQMVRLIFLEQLYRACTIIRGMKYHND